MLMELKKYPDIATTIFNLSDETIQYIQRVVLAEKFRYDYWYYQPDKITADLFMAVLNHVSIFDEQFKPLVDKLGKTDFKAIAELFAILGNQQEMVNVYRAMIDSKINMEINRIPFYFPIMRFGYWALSAQKIDPTTEKVIGKSFSRSDSKRELLTEKERLEKEGYEITYFGSIRELVKNNFNLIRDDISLFEIGRAHV